MSIIKGLVAGACVVTALLSACGGGGGGEAANAATGGTTGGTTGGVSINTGSTGSSSGSTGSTSGSTGSTSGSTGSTSGGTGSSSGGTTGTGGSVTPATATLANAGPAQTVVVGSNVSLDGSASTVQSGRTLSYAWTFVTPAGHALSGASTARPSFTADATGAFTLQLAVSDGLTTSNSTTTVTAVPANASVNASFVASRVSGVAPLAVFFDGSASTAVGTGKPFHDLDYQWSFGESGLGNWGTGARASAISRNLDSGPMAAHVFESPGTYTVTLTATDGSNVGSSTMQVTVTDPEIVFVANTACISVAGNFTGCPSGATHITSSDYSGVINGNATVRRFLFNRGETFTAAGQAKEMRSGPGLIGAYGSGAAPRWQLTAGKTGLTLADPSTPTISDWRVMDIEIDGQGQNTNGVSAAGSINQVLLLRVNIHNTHNGMLFDVSLLDYYNGSQGGNRGLPMWDQLAIVDSRVNTIYGGVGISQNGAAAGYYGGYISASQFTFMGNNFDNVNGGEHVLRTPYVGRGVISHNYLARPDRSKHCLKLHAPSFGGTGTVGGRYSEKIVVADNTFDGNTSEQNVKLAPQNTNSDERIRNVIIERNYFLMGVSSSSALVVQGPVSVVSVRNNIVNASNSASLYPAMMEIIGDGQGVSSAIDFYNNTLYTTGSRFGGIALVGSGALISGINVKNNLAYAPAVATASFGNSSNGSNVVSANNSTDSQVRGVSPGFISVPAASAKSLIATDFKPAAGSYVVGVGAVLPVLTDFYSAHRAVGVAADIGAVVH
jgi:hypothetical protein